MDALYAAMSNEANDNKNVTTMVPVFPWLHMDFQWSTWILLPSLDFTDAYLPLEAFDTTLQIRYE